MRQIQLGACFSVILALAGCSDGDEPLDETGGGSLGGSDATGGRGEETGGRVTGGRDEGGAPSTGGREPATGGVDPTGGSGGAPGGGGQTSTGGAGSGGDVPVVPGCEDPLIQAVVDLAGVEVGGAGGGGGAAPATDGEAFETIQAAVDAAPPGATVHVCAGTHDVGGEPVSIGKPLRVVGAGASATTVENGGFEVSYTSAVSISDVTVTASEHGVTCFGTELRLSSVVLRGNAATEGSGFSVVLPGDVYLFPSVGAGLQAYSCQVELVDSTVSGNDADFGAGVFSEAGALSISGTRIEDNRARCAGGGVGTSLSELQIQSSTVTGNEAGLAPVPDPDTDGLDPCGFASYRQGGGVAVFRGSLDDGAGGFLLADSTVSDNRVDGQAGGVALVEATASGVAATIASSTISGNEATGSGGGVVFAALTGYGKGPLTIVSSTISGNTAGGVLAGYGLAGGGGGLLLDGGHTELVATSVTGNRTPGRGGGVSLTAQGDSAAEYGMPETSLAITTDPASGPSVSANEAAYGAGLHVAGAFSGEGGYAVELSLVNATVSGNVASADGGGIAVAGYGGGVTIDGVLAHVDGNEARGSGAGFHLAEPYSRVTLELSTVSDNTARTEGGGFWLAGSELDLERTEVTGNAATRANGRGGAFFATEKYSSIAVTECTVTGNRAGDGGGAFLDDSDPEQEPALYTARLVSEGTVWGEADTPADNAPADVGFSFSGLLDYATTGTPDFVCSARDGCGAGGGE